MADKQESDKIMKEIKEIKKELKELKKLIQYHRHDGHGFPIADVE